MIFEHEVIDIKNDFMQENSNEAYNQMNKVILFKENDNSSDDDKIGAQAIFLDIRGNYGRFLKEMNIAIQNEYEEFVWSGNLFLIGVKHKDNIIIFEDNTEDEQRKYTLKLDEWLEALEDWKEFYIQQMGFNEFPESKELSHMFGVLLLVYDKIKKDETFIERKVFSISIEQCAERYQITIPTIYEECKRCIKANTIDEFYFFVNKLFLYKEQDLLCRLKVRYRKSDVKAVFERHFSSIFI